MPLRQLITIGLAECRPPTRPRLGLHPTTIVARLVAVEASDVAQVLADLTGVSGVDIDGRSV